MKLFAGTFVGDRLQGLGRLALLGTEAVESLLKFKVSPRDLVYQIYFIGVKSQSGRVLWKPRETKSTAINQAPPESLRAPKDSPR